MTKVYEIRKSNGEIVYAAENPYSYVWVITKNEDPILAFRNKRAADAYSDKHLAAEYKVRLI